MNINSVVLAGNLTHDPRLRELPTEAGSATCASPSTRAAIEPRSTATSRCSEPPERPPPGTSPRAGKSASPGA
jgi:single-stranded DNA-binding protein